MGRYRGYRRRRSYGRPSQKALEHIREAEALSRELGGTVEDVKNYFFSLPKNELIEILDKYQIKHGIKAREYAETTLPKWKVSKVHMSGMVAERLFSLLPPTMPLESKLRLTDSLWKHVGPSSKKTYYIGLDVDLVELSRRVGEHLEEVVIHYAIPSSMEARFNWLSQGDVGIKQQLLNYFRQKEKALLSEALLTQLPVLKNHLLSKEGNLTTRVVQVLKVGKHQVEVVFDEHVSGITDVAPASLIEKVASSWISWVIGIIVLWWIMIR